MPLIATRGNASAGGYGWSSAVAESLDGMVLMTPTSVTATGTGSSATIGANGSVEFSACATLSLNGVFTADYDNYTIVVRDKISTSDARLVMRLRSSGTDNSTSSSYVSQMFASVGTSTSGSRTTADAAEVSFSDGTMYNGMTLHVYGPFLAQPTAVRSVTMSGRVNASIYDYAFTHNQSTSYDGFTIYPATLSTSGLISVYGLEN